jgi:outer membrane protein assembly factor BamD
MRLGILYTITLILPLLFSCSEYNKVVKSDDYERKFELADELYNKKQYDRSIALYEQIYQRLPKEGEGELAYFRIGKAYYEEKDYYMGAYYLGSFVQRFPFSPKAEECMFLSALCSVKNSPEFSLDQNDTDLAINSLQQFINRYPESSLIDSCNNIMDKLRYKLEHKDFEAVRLYSKTENFRAAVESSIAFLEDYPKSVFEEESNFILVNNSFLLAKNSITSKKTERIEKAIERYRNFVIEYPNSDYSRELNSNYDEMEILMTNSGK